MKFNFVDRVYYQLLSRCACIYGVKAGWYEIDAS